MREYLERILQGWGILLIGTFFFSWIQFQLPITDYIVAPLLSMLQLLVYTGTSFIAIIEIGFGVYLVLIYGGLVRQGPVRGWTIPIGAAIIFVGLWCGWIWRPFIHLFPKVEGLIVYYYYPYPSGVASSRFIIGLVSSALLQVVLGSFLITLTIYDYIKPRNSIGLKILVSISGILSVLFILLLSHVQSLSPFILYPWLPITDPWMPLMIMSLSKFFQIPILVMFAMFLLCNLILVVWGLTVVVKPLRSNRFRFANSLLTVVIVLVGAFLLWDLLFVCEFLITPILLMLWVVAFSAFVGYLLKTQ
ncbi:MAG: hypothetical protein ACFE89_10525 [Candidatus Hodarchaeota archaeon]